MKFTHTPFNTAILTTQGMMDLTDHYFRVGTPQKTLKIQYETLIKSNLAIADLINNFLELNLNQQQIHETVRALDKENIRHRISEFTTLPNPNPTNFLHPGIEINSNLHELIPNFDGSYRLYDRYTGFQAGHITDTQSEEWARSYLYLNNKL